MAIDRGRVWRDVSSGESNNNQPNRYKKVDREDECYVRGLREERARLIGSLVCQCIGQQCA